MERRNLKLLIGRHFFSWKHRYLIPNVKGIPSRCQDGMHVLFLDLDSDSIENITAICRQLQEQFDLSDMHILGSSPGNYHMVCTDKMTFGGVMDVMMHPSIKGKTQKYRNFAVVRDKWVMRISAKEDKDAPRYVLTVPNPSYTRQQSHAHNLFLRTNYGIPITCNNEDAYTSVEIDTYPTVRK